MANRWEKWEAEAEDRINLDRISQNFQHLSVYDGEEEEEEIGMRRNVDMNPMAGFRMDQRMEYEGLRNSKEGRFARSSYDSYKNPMLNPNGLNRAENLRLQEMEDDSIRSGNMIKGKGKSYPEPPARRMPYQNEYLDPPPPPRLVQRREVDYPYSPQHPRARVQGYGGRNPYQNPTSYQNQPFPAYSSADQFMNDGMVYTGSSRHHPSCSCFQCNSREAPIPVQSNVHPVKLYREDDGSFNSYEYTLRNPGLPSRTGGTRRCPHRSHLSSAAHQCRPLARAAPFLTCYNCFALLMLPKKAFSKSNDRKKVRCGECSTTIAFTLSNKNLTVLNDDEVEIDIPTKDKSPFEEYDDSRYHFQPMDRDSGQLPRDNSGQHRSASTYAAEVEEDSEELVPDKVTENSTTGMTSATEIDVPSNEYANNTGTTIGSGEGTRGDHRSRAMSYLFKYKRKNVVEDSNGSDETDELEKANVTVNGHLISNRLVRRAEKFAGPIEPGHYWYDSRAGFWGVMGGSCMGIIPPFIAEFNYPMAENCSGGNTSVFVNGRELSHKDLNLLAKRGLPLEQNRSYIIEISGRILVADTGAELPTLGKLAPSLEKAKRGNGMRDPNAPAQPTNL